MLSINVGDDDDDDDDHHDHDHDHDHDDDCLAPQLHSKVVPCTGWLRSIRRRQRLFPSSDLIQESECHHLSTSVSLRKSVPKLTPGKAEGLSRFKISMEGLTKENCSPRPCWQFHEQPGSQS